MKFHCFLTPSRAPAGSLDRAIHYKVLPAADQPTAQKQPLLDAEVLVIEQKTILLLLVHEIVSAR
jgi:hypothetical protein